MSFGLTLGVNTLKILLHYIYIKDKNCCVSDGTKTGLFRILDCMLTLTAGLTVPLQTVWFECSVSRHFVCGCHRLLTCGKSWETFSAPRPAPSQLVCRCPGLTSPQTLSWTSRTLRKVTHPSHPVRCCCV